MEIINNLKSLGKTYLNEEMVKKLLQCLPRSKPAHKFTTIEEAQDLKTLKLNILMENF